MDAGTSLFRDLDAIYWSRLEDPESPYEMAGFPIPQDPTRRGNEKKVPESLHCCEEGELICEALA